MKPSMKKYHIRKCVYNLLLLFLVFLVFLVTTLHKLGPKTLYHSSSQLTMMQRRISRLKKTALSAWRKRGRELLISVFSVQLHNAQFYKRKNRSTVPYGFIVRRPYQICLRSSEDTFDFIAFSIWIKALTEQGRLK